MLIDLDSDYRAALEFVIELAAVDLNSLGILSGVLKGHDVLFAADDILFIGADLLNVVSAERKLVCELCCHILSNLDNRDQPVCGNDRAVRSLYIFLCIESEHNVLCGGIISDAVLLVMLHILGEGYAHTLILVCE